MVFILCGLAVLMDGFDVQAMGYVAPALVRDWKISSGVLGPVFSAALAGIMLGSLVIGALGDRIGRRPVLVFGTLFFAATTLLTARATSIPQLLAVRLLAGFGLGGVMPNAMSLAGEKSPKHIRVFVMMVVSCGFTAGAAIGGFISAWMIPAWGWRSVFLFGGCAPILVAALMALYLPESDAFLAARGKRHNREDVSIRRLFQQGRALATILLWIVNFMNLLNLYFLGSWLPTLAQGAGYATSIAVTMGAVVQVGGVIGTITNAKIIERFGFVMTLAPCFAVGAIAVGMIGQPFLSLPLLFAALFIAGWSVPGGQPGVNALAGVYYPTDIRSTGIGWGLGIGRIGGILGPLIGGALIAHQWSTREVFAAAALPAAISAIAMIGLRGPIKFVPATIPAPAEPVGQMR